MQSRAAILAALLASLLTGCRHSTTGAEPVPNSGSAAAGTATARTIRIAGWLPSWTRTSGGRSIAANVGDGLDEVNPFWYALEADGSLSARSGARDAALMATIRNGGGEVIPTVFDVHDRDALSSVLASATRRQRAIDAIVAEIHRYGYDGIDIDFEHARSSTRDAFSAFMADLGLAVRDLGKVFSLTIPGKRRDRPSWAGYDYAALAPTADRIKIMTYGYSGPWSSQPGPIAPVTWMRRVLDYAITVMPAAKIQLGIPFYGYDWPADGSKVRSVTWSSAQSRLSRSAAGRQFDSSLGETRFDYRDDSGVEHTVWFQDAAAIRAKAAVVKEYHLAGLSIWALGYGDESFWDELRGELKNPR